MSYEYRCHKMIQSLLDGCLMGGWNWRGCSLILLSLIMKSCLRSGCPECFFWTLCSTIRYVPVILFLESQTIISLKWSFVIPRSLRIPLASFTSSDAGFWSSRLGFKLNISRGPGNSSPSSQSQRLISSSVNLSCGTCLRMLRIRNWQLSDTYAGIE